MDVNISLPCYLISLSSFLFNTPRYLSLLNSLHSFDALSVYDDFTALLWLNLHKLYGSYLFTNIVFVI